MIPYKPTHKLFADAVFAIAPNLFMLIIGFIIFVLICLHFLKKEKKFRLKEYLIFLTILILFSLQGGKVWHYFGNSKHHSNTSFLLYFINPGVGGITSYGMLVGGIIGFILLMFIFRKNKPSANLIDIISIATASWIFLYRIGCLIDGNSYGIKTTVFWALYYFEKDYARHPVQLYLSLSGLFIFIILWLRYKHRLFKGENALLFFFFYGFNRVWIEVFRYYKVRYFGLSLSQYISLGIFLIALFVLKWRYSKLKIKKSKDPIGFYLSNKKFRTVINILFAVMLIFSLVKPGRLLIGSALDKDEFQECPYEIRGNLSSNVRIMYFSSPYCPACWEEELLVFPFLFEKYGSQFYMAKYDIRFCRDMMSLYNIKGTPSFVFKNKNTIKEFVSYGYVNLKQMKNTISSLKGAE